MGYKDVFDQEKFSLENVEWALNIVDSRLLYIGYEAFLVPMLDSITPGQAKSDKLAKVFKPEVEKTTKKLTFSVMEDIKKGDKMYRPDSLRVNIW